MNHSCGKTQLPWPQHGVDVHLGGQSCPAHRRCPQPLAVARHGAIPLADSGKGYVLTGFNSTPWPCLHVCRHEGGGSRLTRGPRSGPDALGRQMQPALPILLLGTSRAPGPNRRHSPSRRPCACSYPRREWEAAAKSLAQHPGKSNLPPTALHLMMLAAAFLSWVRSSGS